MFTASFHRYKLRVILQNLIHVPQPEGIKDIRLFSELMYTSQTQDMKYTRGIMHGDQRKAGWAMARLQCQTDAWGQGHEK